MEPKGTGAVSNERNGHKRRKRSPEEIVHRLQARIVKAQEMGKRRKVKALQSLLTRSQSARILAVERVTQNDGRKTPGIDGETWLTPEKKAAGMETLKRRGYRPKPLRRIYIPKKNGKKRPLGIPTMTDRAMQAIYLLAVDPVAETTADPNSYGFRRERSCADAIEQCFCALAKKTAVSWVLEGDIRACFDRIDHDWLLSHAPMDKEILRKWLKAGYLESSVFYPTEEGTPQGGIISPVLANLALDGMERMLAENFSKKRADALRNKVHLIRYADDFVITGSSKELLELQVKPLVAQFLAERGLELSQEKTAITHIEDGFDFLGQNVRKYNGKLIIKPSKQNVSSFLANIREVVKSHKAVTAGELVRMLNPKIKGWAMYHRHICASEAYHQVDDAIFQALWRWCLRRHPNKNRRWVAEKYFTTVPGEGGGNRWVFFGEVKRANGERQTLVLFKATRVSIVRHIKIRADVNPYSPDWANYLQRRHRREEDRSRAAAGSRSNAEEPTGHGDVRNHPNWTASVTGR
jgi:RNA-directed DNA polymerase